MRDRHLLAGRTVRLKLKTEVIDALKVGHLCRIETGDLYRIEDWWQNVSGKSWMLGLCNDNPACLIYSMRVVVAGLPYNDEVVYGKIGSYGHLIHISELGEIVDEKKCKVNSETTTEEGRNA